MTPEQLTEVLKIVGWIMTGGVGVAVINWLANRGKIKAEADKSKADELKTLQQTWHEEFDRLEKRIECLENDVKGRDVTIEHLTKEIARLNTEIRGRDKTIEKLTARIKELERLMKKYDIDPDCGKAEQ